MADINYIADATKRDIPELDISGGVTGAFNEMRVIITRYQKMARLLATMADGCEAHPAYRARTNPGANCPECVEVWLCKSELTNLTNKLAPGDGEPFIDIEGGAITKAPTVIARRGDMSLPKISAPI